MRLSSKKNSQGKFPRYLVILGLIAFVLSIIDSYQRGEFKKIRQHLFAAMKETDFAWASGVVIALVIIMILLNKFRRSDCPNCKSPAAFLEKANYCRECGFELTPQNEQRLQNMPEAKPSTPTIQQSKLARQKLKSRIREIQSHYFKFEIPFWFLFTLLVWFFRKTGWLESLDVETRIYMGAAVFCIPFVFRLLEDMLWRRVSNCPHCSTALPQGPLNTSGRTQMFFWHMYFPDFCSHCRCQLTDKDFNPDALVPFLHFSARMMLTIMILNSIM